MSKPDKSQELVVKYKRAFQGSLYSHMQLLLWVAVEARRIYKSNSLLLLACNIMLCIVFIIW